jgi:hypothetical protein
VLFPRIFSSVLRRVAGYVTKYAGKSDRKEAQRKLNINLKRGKFKQGLTFNIPSPQIVMLL